ncbi:hypothetical protein [Flavobacterium chungangense]|uniref:Uncharacterized protein n=1 Tax=Flavobacterium chungangense TaxID=554283 RepID=A0A6V6YZP4_9FLAO|nr:hypothetical protein [Flavobacterium chungangense]CAD0004789.1 hypothetical protein FLACHUCJ7_02007 [Flavobacterium chungangense]
MNREIFMKNYCWIAYLHPYTFVTPDDEQPWEVELDEINKSTYNHGRLIQIVSKIKTENNELDALVCYDGAIAIARNGKFHKKEEAVNFFNKLFAKLIFNGFYVEGVNSRDVVSGVIYEEWGIFNTEFGGSASSQSHSKVRTKMAGSLDTINLSSPRHLMISELRAGIEKGSKIFDEIPNLTPKFLNMGITEIRYGNWDLVLSNLWITSEQMIDYLWHNRFLKNQSFHPEHEIDGRKKSFKEDNRTWSMAIKQELLYQNSIITESILINLFNARKVRNKLVHEGRAVDKKVALGLFTAVKELIQIVIGPEDIMNNKIFSENTAASGKYEKKSDAIKFDESLYTDWQKIIDEQVNEEQKKNRLS